MRRALVLSFSLGVLALAGAATALSAENKNSISFDIHCATDSGPVTLTGTLIGGAGAALHLEGGGIAINMGLQDASGNTLVPLNPGLLQQGKLVQCTFTFPGQPQRIAFAFFAPPGTL